MNIYYEVYMASIHWEKIGVVSNFKLGKSPLDPVDSNIYETTIYSRTNNDFCQIAIKSKNIVRDSVTGNHLFRIPNSDIWIIKYEWRLSYDKKGYHYCPSINTVGKLLLSIENIDIQINIVNNIPDFNFIQLKEDFQGEFWELLTSSSSNVYIQKNKKIFIVNEIVESFLTIFKQITKSPKKAIKRTKEFLPSNKVKPIIDTYRQLAKNGLNLHELLPSKAYTEHIDLFENQYLCQMLSDVKKIVDNNVRFNKQRIKRLEQENDSIKHLLLHWDEPEKLNEDDIIEEGKRQLEAVKQLEADLLSVEKSSNKNSTIEHSKNTILIKYLFNQNEYSYWCYLNGTYCIIVLPKTMFSKVKMGIEYQVFTEINETGKYIDKNEKERKKYTIVSLSSIDSSELTNARRVLENTRSNYKILKQNNFYADSIQSPQEKRNYSNERKVQRKTLEERIIKNIETITIDRKTLEAFTAIQLQFQKIINSTFFTQISQVRINKFRPSLTFIQNSHYKKVYEIYQTIISSIGINADSLDLYKELEQYSIRELPQIYELWCLVSTINILEKFFHNKVNRVDIMELLKSIVPTNKKVEKYIKVRFEGKIPERSVTLHYQRAYISNNKRPDILLEIKCESRRIFLIIDAKFKNYRFQSYASSESIDMVDKYKESDKNRFVFTVHPRMKAENNSLLTNLGGQSIKINNEHRFPFHEYGYLAAQPGKIDNLRKVLSMAFEYLVETNHNARKEKVIDPLPDYPLICINCGENDFDKKEFIRRIIGNSKRVHYNYTCKNTSCHHIIKIDYCWNCKTKLFKHGRYWDYHRTSVWSEMDIHCPQCGLTTADRPKDTYFTSHIEDD